MPRDPTQLRRFATATLALAVVAVATIPAADARGHRGGRAHVRHALTAPVYAPVVRAYPAYPVYAPVVGLYPAYSGYARYGYGPAGSGAYLGGAALASTLEGERIEFLRLNPCPANGEFVAVCPGYVVDRESIAAGEPGPAKLYWRALVQKTAPAEPEDEPTQ